LRFFCIIALFTVDASVSLEPAAQDCMARARTEREKDRKNLSCCLKEMQVDLCLLRD